MHLVNTHTTRKVTVNQKKKINYIWMLLGTNYISEICTVDGTGFVPGAVNILSNNLCDMRV